MANYWNDLKQDISASIVVFFVAVPLCLGIALTSGAPLFSGIIAGIVGGIVVGSASHSALGVSGPAAGLSAVVLAALTLFNHSWETFLLSLFLAGLIQIIAGYCGGGIIAYYFPSSVIKGMLTGIGIIIIIKQIPFALGLHSYLKGGMAIEGVNHIFSPLLEILYYINPYTLLVTILSLLILLIWEKFIIKINKSCQMIPSPLLAVLFGIFLVWLGQKGILACSFSKDLLVSIPLSNHFSDFFKHFYFPDFSQLTNLAVYRTAIIIAAIASIETLLCVEATDKLDPEKRVTPTDRELKAQGLGNMICGLVGGLPVTQVIVRSSANIAFGAKTKRSAIFHGILLLICVLTIPSLLNMIPLATLSAVLFIVGYQLAKPSIFIQMYKRGWDQFTPFMATILGVVFEDLLVGIGIGMGIAIFIILRNNYRNSHEIIHEKSGQKKIYLALAEEVSFLNKGNIIHELNDIPIGASVTIDCSRSKVIDHDVSEAIQDFLIHAQSKNIKVQLIE